MATVAHMRSSKATSQENGKLPSFAAEADLFISEEDTEASPSIKPSKDKNVGTNVENNQQQQIKEESNTAEKQITVKGEAEISSSFWHVEQPTSKDKHILDRKQSLSAPVSLDTPHLTESNMSLHEMFDNDDVPFNMSERKASEPTSQDEWFRGDGDLLVKQDRLSTTPPLSLYSQQKASSSEADDALDSPEWSYPASLETSQSGSVTTNTQEIPTSSVSSHNSSAPRSMRPILYSAIGSLENLNSTSMGSLKKRLLTEPREFSRMGAAQSALIPPPKQSEVKNRNSRTQTTSKARSSRSGSDTQPSERFTPPASNMTEQKIGDCENHSAPGHDASKSVDQQQTPETKSRKPSNLRTSSVAALRDPKGPSSSDRTAKARNSGSKKVSYDKSSVKQKQPIEMFRPSCDAYTPRMEKKRIKYMPAEMRTPVQKMASPMGTLHRPNFKDALRRVAMIVHQHIVKIERRFEGIRIHDDEGLFKASMRDTFCEAAYCTPTYKCTMVRIPMARPGMVYGLRKIRTPHNIPSEGEIYEFAHQLFKSVQLSSECSIVCLIYVERLMEIAKVPLLASTWRPIFMCGLLLASKVWQDLSSWNIEFASVYPQYSLDAINRLEINFLRNVKWDLYISSRCVHVLIKLGSFYPTIHSHILSLSLYAKYYFALRSLVEKVDFRQRYNRMVGGVDSVAQSEALKIQKRTEQVKEEALNQLSRSM
jgi:hypothetical protein